MKQWLIIGAIILVVLGSYIWNRDRNNQIDSDSLPSAEEIITQEDGTIIKKTGDLIEEMSQEEAEVKRQEIEANVANAVILPLKAVEGQTGRGTSARSFENGIYSQKIQVEGMTPLQKGFFYETGIEKLDGSRVSIGRLEMNGSNGNLLYSTKEDKTAFVKIVVSRKAENGTAAAGEVVLSGNY